MADRKPRRWRRPRIRHLTVNCLGDSHTRKGGNKAGKWAASKVRTGWLIALLLVLRPTTISFQEFQSPQAREFRRAIQKRYGVYAIADNAVAWRKSRIRFIEGRSFAIPYFHGKPKRMPLAVLRLRGTDQELLVSSVHNPANVRGPAGPWRREGWENEDEAFAETREEYPGALEIPAGDRNAKSADYARHIPAGTELVTAGVDDRDIDHICVSKWAKVRRVFAVARKLTRRITDHPLIVAVIVLPKEKP